MKMLIEDANAVLALCRDARQSRSTIVAGALLRMPALPPMLQKAASDAVYFVINGEECEGAIPVDALPQLSGGHGEEAFVESV
jgi:hypothetical protein